jgi:hydrogenase maturation protein HypF
VRRVFHHHAHASALYGEFGLEQPLLVFTWDGLGWGADGTLWGGEALLGQPGAWRRVGSWRPFRLIGGDRASRDPWRCALALCLEAGLDWNEAPDPATLARAAWVRGINCPLSTSVGRLFDAAAALTGIAQTQTYEGQAAMRLEAEATEDQTGLVLPLDRDGELWRADWSPLLPLLMDARRTRRERASLFHASLARLIVAQAEGIRRDVGLQDVGLTGGVFQNRRLTGLARNGLLAAGFSVWLPEQLPVNDAAISFGQIVEAEGQGNPV